MKELVFLLSDHLRKLGTSVEAKQMVLERLWKLWVVKCIFVVLICICLCLLNDTIVYNPIESKWDTKLDVYRRQNSFKKVWFDVRCRWFRFRT